MDGYIRLYRKILENPVFQNANLLKVFIWCLLKATYKERDVLVGLRTIKLYPGQFIYGRKSASSELDMPESSVRNYMDTLKKLKILDIKSDNKYSLVTLVNWEVYQADNEEMDNKKDKNRTTVGQQQDTNNKDNKDNKDKKKILFIENSNEFQLCLNLKSFIQKNNPGAKTPDDLQKWAVEFDRMIRLDHRSVEDIQAVMEFSQADLFWKANILSPKKLREKFDTLFLQKDKTRLQPVKKEKNYDFDLE